MKSARENWFNHLPIGKLTRQTWNRDKESAHRSQKSSRLVPSLTPNLHTMQQDDPLIRERLARQIVHELRNPLTAIKIASEMIEQADKMGGLTLAERSAFTTIIQKNVVRMEEMIKKLVGAREEVSQAPMRVTNLCHVADAALLQAKDRLFLRNIEIQKTYGEGCIIRGNAHRLTTAFLNLIINAIEAQKSGRGKIWISIYSAANAINVVIKDNGKRIPADILEQIFEAGFSGKPGGLGLGLATVKEILDMHNATIKVDSEPGIGTSFVIAFRNS